ncbi:cytochrome P450 [Noviherbaspirillum aerium]|uniref:cytochrome P450 n=1 Tax=Noviherbaspirillum aerium TaxID=2588497 RepID=UPI00124DFCB3|nr:cytochrome P450 [Noviherbaspirillum aerium]
MKPIPRDKALDSTLALLREAYNFIPNRCGRLRTDMFETRLMGQKVICVSGEAGAAMFYQPDRFTRKHALPPTALLLLQDLGSVQLLDGEAHRRRKQMFMALMRPERIGSLTQMFAEQWHQRLRQWESAEQVVLHHEMEQLLCKSVCEWTGLSLTDAALEQRTREFSAMIDGAGAVGPRSWRGMRLRSRTEDWIRSVIMMIRAGHMQVPDDSAAQIIALHRDADGELLDNAVAAVELINILRPTVAVARYITFAALALHRYPDVRARLLSAQSREDDYLGWFVQEVRRFYPFFPAVGGRVREEFTWRGLHFAQGTWVLLDIYGTNHDPHLWKDPQTFRPERFRDWNASPHNFIPQGDGDFDLGHRCAGEWLTIELVKTATRLLLFSMDYDVPAQDLRIDMSRMPAIPESRFVISQVRHVFSTAEPVMEAESGLMGSQAAQGMESGRSGQEW